MRVYGNLMNRVAEGIQSAAPKVGDGATIYMYSDRHAATVVAVSANGKTVSVQEDIVKRVDKNGMSESQEWSFEPNPQARADVYTLRKNGQYVRQGEPIKNGTVIRFGKRDHYYDFSF